MQLNKLLKGLAIALPLFTLAACSSSSDSDAAGAESGMTDGMGGVQTGGASGMLSPEEQMRQKFEALQRDNVIYFPFDGYDIQGQYADLLDAHASYLRERPSVKVLIEGHADERGTPEYNIALGERRAKAVAKYLQTLGVQAEQLSIVSYGEEKPLDLSHTEDAFAKNRRAVLVY
ncbi:peptidoglycan-associated lipoprotein Pal [Aeromonas salmonicida]|uniref:peptidoglycan-associated lipoprotein Pal n=1 Tax=Aeromonas salmonicida TaxID=645 RepID=UPI00073C2BEB|nr:peptidoglycan-associated lipoprotein Pal [Aeromonas salmonicida]KTA80702.1 lipoprotein [Aeromonas salmonicida]MDE7529610.1 peptidoglycan-associated lipoprotein Pal [Aeromonas salmonicida]MDE7533876.1 peptidoglycan-associated lipoprotein Pal [Aeromonas salmonicida]